jgi:hypothetical protein
MPKNSSSACHRTAESGALVLDKSVDFLPVALFGICNLPSNLLLPEGQVRCIEEHQMEASFYVAKNIAELFNLMGIGWVMEIEINISHISH